MTRTPTHKIIHHQAPIVDGWKERRSMLRSIEARGLTLYSPAMTDLRRTLVLRCPAGLRMVGNESISGVV